MNAVFVYGTLRFSDLFEGSPLASIKGFNLYVSRSSLVPGIDYSKDPNNIVIGNIRTFDPITFRKVIYHLDYLEGAIFHPPSYFRRTVNVKCHDGSSVPTYAYIMNFTLRNKKEDFIRIIDGDYKAFMKRMKINDLYSNFRIS